MLSQLSTPNTVISEENMILSASSNLRGTAAIWWIIVVNNRSVLATWNKFKNAVSREFVSAEHVKRACDCLLKLQLSKSVSIYLEEFRNIVLNIGGMQEDEKIDRFIEGLKFDVWVELLKARAESFEKCARLALSVDNAFWKAGRRSQGPNDTRCTSGSGPTLMEIGTVQSDSRSLTVAQREQRRKDLKAGACFTWHRVGCRPWKHNRKTKNMDVELEENASGADLSDSTSGEE